MMEPIFSDPNPPVCSFVCSDVLARWDNESPPAIGERVFIDGITYEVKEYEESAEANHWIVTIGRVRR